MAGSTQANPYLNLKVPRRELHVDTALTQTKINPAFMTRQISDIAKKYNNIQFHIKSTGTNDRRSLSPF